MKSYVNPISSNQIEFDRWNPIEVQSSNLNLTEALSVNVIFKLSCKSLKIDNYIKQLVKTCEEREFDSLHCCFPRFFCILKYHFLNTFIDKKVWNIQQLSIKYWKSYLYFNNIHWYTISISDCIYRCKKNNRFSNWITQYMKQNNSIQGNTWKIYIQFNQTNILKNCITRRFLIQLPIKAPNLPYSQFAHTRVYF